MIVNTTSCGEVCMRRDELLKSYLSDNTRYADLINGYVFEGRQVVRPEDVTELDIQRIKYCYEDWSMKTRLTDSWNLKHTT